MKKSFNKTMAARDKDLLVHARQVVREMAELGQSINLNELSERVKMCQPFHFYHNYGRASQILHLIDRVGIEAVSASCETREGWLDLYSQVCHLREVRRRLTFDQAITQVLAFGRPKRFYLNATTIRRILSPYFRARLFEWTPGRA